MNVFKRSLSLITCGFLLSTLSARGDMTLTSDGVAAGFSLTTFATGFTNSSTGSGVVGPLGIAFSPSGIVLVGTFPGDLYRLPNNNGQKVTSANIVANTGLGSFIGLSSLGNRIFEADRFGGSLFEITTNNNYASVNFNAFGPSLNQPEDLLTNFATGKLLVSSLNGIFEVDPNNGNSRLVTSTPGDGMVIDPTGTTVYLARGANDVILGFNIKTGAQTYNSGFTGLGQFGIDGIALGAGSLSGTLFVNDNSGDLWSLNLNNTSQSPTLLAVGGSRGDFLTLDPTTGKLLITQSDRILSLTAPNGGGFAQSVPEPSPAILFSVGLAMILGCRISEFHKSKVREESRDFLKYLTFPNLYLSLVRLRRFDFTSRFLGSREVNFATSSLPLIACAYVYLSCATNAGQLIYSSSESSPTIQKVAVGGSTSTLTNTLAGTYGIATDSAGNIYYSEFARNDIVKVSADGLTKSVYASGITGPYGLLFDKNDNLYFSSPGTKTVSMISHSSGTVTTFATYADAQYDLAFDTSGNLFSTAFYAGKVSEVVVGGGTPTTILSGLSGNPVGIAFDSTNALYLSNFGGVVYKVAGTTLNPFATGFGAAFGIGFDSTGTLFVADYGSSTIKTVGSTGGTATVYATSLSSITALTFAPNPPSSAVPEPGTLALCMMGIGFAAAKVMRRRLHIGSKQVCNILLSVSNRRSSDRRLGPTQRGCVEYSKA